MLAESQDLGRLLRFVHVTYDLSEVELNLYPMSGAVVKQLMK